MENKIKLNNADISIRNELLKEIYKGEEFSSSILTVMGLEIYTKKTSFYDNLRNVIKESVLESNIILTDEQMECLNMLNSGDLFISAPTSFGKTFIAFEFIARNIQKLNTIVFIVPTIALMNEIRNKCFKYFGDTYITITSEAELDKYILESKKILILVPERIQSKSIKKYLNNENVDFTVYDEIYKLNANPDNDGTRLIIMNYTYKYLIENSKKILLLGPFIRDVKFNRSERNFQKYITNLNLIYNDVIRNYNHDLNYFNNRNDTKQFVYFLTPNRITTFINENNLIIEKINEVNYDVEIVDWMIKNIHQDWYYVDFLKKGIGIHHGNTPMFLRKFIEEEYKNGFIHTILCTSTLIEGVNTPTNKLIIHDCPRNVFELNNLIGRVGRLNVQSPNKGEIYFIDETVNDLYDPENMIDLRILYEEESILSNNKEDELLYLEKKGGDDIKNKIDSVKSLLLNIYNINYEEALELGVEFKVLENFLKYFDDLKNIEKDYNVLNMIVYKIIPGNKPFLNGLKLNQYSFGANRDEETYLNVNPLYLLLVSTKGIKKVIEEFIKKYDNATKKDINIFIETVFKIDEFIKFKLSKIVPVYYLFDNHSLFNKEEHRAFKQCIKYIEIYGNVLQGYERILEDVGFPNEDIILIANEIIKINDVNGTENKLKSLIHSNIYNLLSPFGKKIISNYNKK